LRDDSNRLACCLKTLTDRIYSLTDDVSTLSQSFSCLPRGVGSRPRAATIEHAERKNPERQVHKASLQVIAGAKCRLQCVAKLILSGFGNVVE